MSDSATGDPLVMNQEDPLAFLQEWYRDQCAGDWSLVPDLRNRGLSSGVRVVRQNRSLRGDGAN